MNLVVAFEGTGSRAIKEFFAGRKDVEWFYIGEDHLKRRQLQETLGDAFKYHDITREYFDAAGNLADEYVQWIDQLNREHGHYVEWWFGAISSRNHQQTRIFRYACYLEVLKKKISRTSEGTVLVFVPSQGMLKTVAGWGKSNGLSVAVLGAPRAFLKSVGRKFYALLRWGKFVAVSLLRIAAANTYRPRRILSKEERRFDALVVTIIHDYSISDKGIFNDRYFPHLHEFLHAQKSNTAVFGFFYGFGFKYSSIYKRLRQSEANFLVPEDVLGFFDHLWIWMYPWRVLSKKCASGSLRNVDLTPMIREEFWEESSVLGLQPAMAYRWLHQLAAQSYTFNRAIVWYEDRVEDKAIAMGLRKFFPDTLVVGAQLFLHLPLSISQRVSKEEALREVIPHVFYQTSEGQCQIAKSFNPDILCRPVPALRYAHMFKDEHAATDAAGKHILVALPFKIPACVELLEMMDKVADSLPQGTRILVRNHPDYSMDELKEAYGPSRWPVYFEPATGPLPNVLKEVAVMVSFPSNIVIEAAIKGLPVVFVYGQTLLDQNPLKDFHLKWVEDCYSSSEIKEALKRFLRLSPSQRREFSEMGKSLKEIFFSPVNDQGMRIFLEDKALAIK